MGVYGPVVELMLSQDAMGECIDWLYRHVLVYSSKSAKTCTSLQRLKRLSLFQWGSRDCEVDVYDSLDMISIYLHVLRVLLLVLEISRSRFASCSPFKLVPIKSHSFTPVLS